MSELPLRPAFNKRPLARAAFGLALGIVAASFLTGTQALAAACLLFLAGMLLTRRRADYSVFLIAAAFGCARMLPQLDISAPLPWGSLSRLAPGSEVPELLKGAASSLGERCGGLFASPALVRAILLGDRSSLSYFETSVFRDAGAAHVLALSGLHVSVLAALLLLLIPKRRPGLRFAAAAVFLALYSAIAGFPASLLRAAIMTLCMLIAPLFNRRNDPLSSLSMAFIAILMLSPLSLFSAGFKLSFSAVAGILMLSRPVERALRPIPRAIASSLSVTLAATLGTLPFTLLIFGRLPLYSLVSNLIVVPLITLALPIALAALLLSFVFYPLGALIAWPASILFGAAEWLCEKFAALPMSVIYFDGVPALSCALFFLALVFASVYCLWPLKRKLAVSASLLALASLSLLLG